MESHPIRPLLMFVAELEKERERIKTLVKTERERIRTHGEHLYGGEANTIEVDETVYVESRPEAGDSHGITAGAVTRTGDNEGFTIGHRSRHNSSQNAGPLLLPYKAKDLFPGLVMRKCRAQPEPLARLSPHRLHECRMTATNKNRFSVPTFFFPT
ncbi:hypothetical protein EVAR_70236_1 [Eumeta japonica]|uniref:Uncharacterized protein n=1 Tax=Eumeta variegata TaxID=151549 RepID=A0A4C1SRN0_EUMVA|nr:hypothetical protein EVAR_70236_1 [Eumeta japonica]